MLLPNFVYFHIDEKSRDTLTAVCLERYLKKLVFNWCLEIGMSTDPAL